MKFLEVQCENPGAPANGYAQGSAPYRAGDVVQFNCNPGYMMQGQPIIACQDSGRWSGVLPKCNSFFLPEVLRNFLFHKNFCFCFSLNLKRRSSLFISRNSHCRSYVISEILLYNWWEYYIHVRCWTFAPWCCGVEMLTEWKMVECDTNMCGIGTERTKW